MLWYLPDGKFVDLLSKIWPNVREVTFFTCMSSHYSYQFRKLYCYFWFGPQAEHR